MASRCFDTKPLSLHPQNARTHTVTSRIGSSGRRLDKGATGVLCRFLNNKMKHQTNALGHRRARGWRAAAGLAMVATLLLAGSPTAGGKSIDPQQAALIAQRYVRLHLIIYSTTPVATVLLSWRPTTRWVRCWPMAPQAFGHAQCQPLREMAVGGLSPFV